MVSEETSVHHWYGGRIKLWLLENEILNRFNSFCFDLCDLYDFSFVVIYDIYFREFKEKIFFASINLRELGDQNENFHTKNGLKLTNASWIRLKLVFYDFDEAFKA